MPGYEDVAEVSNIGNVRTFNRFTRNGRPVSARELTKLTDKDGYLIVGLNRDGYQRKIGIHRLVAMAFISGSGSMVNHLNGIKSDNRAENLEWCDASRNEKHAYQLGLKRRPQNTYPGSRHSRFGGFIVAKNISTGRETILEGRRDIESKGFSQSCVLRCVHGKSAAHKGHTFKFLEIKP
ncbi:HNH endonuclease [Pantoea septica]|uniref:HNH endonuclease n=1 Tax=Pantoea septica TaxID=472695 RepID=UPI003D0334DB